MKIVAALLCVLALQDSPESAVESIGSWEPEQRNQSIERLCRLKSDGKLDLLIPLLKSTDYGSRAAEALAMMGPRSLVSRIAALLPEANLFTRCAAVGALGGIGGEEARSALLEDLMRTETDPKSTLWALGQVGRPEDAVQILPFLKGSERGVEALPIAELASKGAVGREQVVEALKASKTLGARIAMVRLGRAGPAEVSALFDELLRPVLLLEREPPRETLSYGPFGVELNRALEAVHEPRAFAAFEKEFVLEKPIDTLDDLHFLVERSGFTLDLGRTKACGRLPSGIRTSLRRVCDWILDQNIDAEVIGDLTRGHERRVVLQGTTVKLLRLRRQAEYWKARLEGR